MERIRRVGPISFDDYLDTALYGHNGFFTRGAGAGRRGHFLTSPEVGALFANLVARALDSWWTSLGRPDPFLVAEVGAGTGTLAAGIRRAGPACAKALRYVLVERTAALRERHGQHLSLEPPSTLLRAGPDVDPEADPLVGTGPRFASLAQLPGQPFVGVVLANELLDNMALVLLQRSRTGWLEVRVGEKGGDLVEVLVPAAPPLAAEADRLVLHARPGGRIPLQHRARSWLGQALARVERGLVVVIDYTATTPLLATRPWEEWLRTYRAHHRGEHPLSRSGAQDVTCEVAVDQLALVRRPSTDRSQAEFLAAHGLEELVESARATWWERASSGDLEALRARSLVGEAEALTDPAGLGAFRVLEWETTT